VACLSTLPVSFYISFAALGDSFEEGEQLFENYGQPNHVYYLYHGFILPDNAHDCVHYHLFFENKEFGRLQTDGLTDYLEVRMVFAAFCSVDLIFLLSSSSMLLIFVELMMRLLLVYHLTFQLKCGFLWR
jgi:hypothetical protein